MNGGDISAVNGDMATCAGGIAGCNRDTGTVENCSVTKCKIEAGKSGNKVAAGGIVGWNENGDVTCAPAPDNSIIATNGEFVADLGVAGIYSIYAGAKIGFDEGQQSPV